MVPEGWEVLSLQELLVSHAPGLWGGPPTGVRDTSVLRSTNLRDDGTLDFTKPALRALPEQKLAEKLLRPGDILLERSGGGPRKPVGRVARFDSDSKFCFSNFMQRLRPDPTVSDSAFLTYVLWNLHATGTTNLLQQATTGIRNLNFNDYLGWPLQIPPLGEQKKIAEILGSVDEAIQATQAVIDQTRKVKQGLLQQLLTCGIGHTRFKQTDIGEIPEAWEMRRTGEMLSRVRRPVSVDATKHYQEIGIRSHARGIFHKEPILGQKLGNKRVFWVEPGCFVVNIVFAWERAVSSTSIRESGMIASHRFPMYQPVDDQLLMPFITLYFQSQRGQRSLALASPGGAGRNKTLGQQEFLKIPVPLPSPDEQVRIVEAAHSLVEDLNTKEEHLDCLIRTKKGLMQDLLTGRISVKTEHTEAVTA